MRSAIQDPKPPAQSRAATAEEARAFQGTQPNADEAELARLASLSPLEYDRTREASAQVLGIRIGTLDTEVEKRRRQAEAATASGEFPDVEAWEQYVSGCELLDAIEKLARRFLVLSDEAFTALTLWIAFTYFVEDVGVAPILAVVSPEKRCGKSTLLMLLSRLVCKPMPAANITPAALYRSIERWGPTILIDEADTFLQENPELRGVLNSGHTRATAYVVRTVGDEHEPKRFRTWGAKAIAKIGTLPDTLRDRSIPIELRRKLPNEKTEKLRHVQSNEFEELTRKLTRFARDNASLIGEARPEIPDCLNDRAADNWEPLLAIAIAAGGGWFDIATKAAIALSGEFESATDSIKVQLLADVRDVFGGAEKMTSEDLVIGLTAKEESPWAEIANGKPLTKSKLAKLLRPFAIVPVTIRIGAHTAKGYTFDQFQDAFARYLTAQTVTPSQVNNQGMHRVSGKVTDMDVLHIRNSANTPPCAQCDGVTVPTGGSVIEESELVV